MTKIVVTFLDTNRVEIELLFESSFISESEKDGFRKYSHPRVRKEKIASTYLKNKYIKDYYINENGKPLCKDKFFSISHSNGVVVLVIDEVPIGIDIELVRDFETELADYISSNEEKNYIKDRESFFEVWTNKEALVKVLGEGLKRNIKDIPSLPLNKKREYYGHTFSNKTIKFQDYIISVSRESIEEFELEISENI